MERDEHGQPVFEQKVVQMEGQAPGVVGDAGKGAPGPTIRVVAVPMWNLILERSLFYHYVNGLMAVAGLDGTANAVGEVMGVQIVAPAHFLTHLGFILVGAVVPALMGGLRDLSTYTRKRRLAAGLQE